jgi:hypothetical protein
LLVKLLKHLFWIARKQKQALIGESQKRRARGGQLEETRREEGGKQLGELRKLRKSIGVTAHL